MTDYEMEEFADMAVQETREFLSVEDQLIQTEHQLIDALYSWDNILGHIDERVSEAELVVLSSQISEKIVELREFIGGENKVRVRLTKEEQATEQKLEEAIRHKNWRLVKALEEVEIKEQEQAERLTKDEIKTIHSMFVEIMKLIKTSAQVNLSEDSTKPIAKEEWEKTEMHYFSEIYKFSRAYERIFRNLWGKERILLGEIKKKI